MNRTLKSYMYELMDNDSELVARKALDVMVELYRRQVFLSLSSL